MSLLAIGDIHGNIRALDDLLEKIIPELSAADTVVFLGDYIDRGPSARECVDRIIELNDAAAFSVITLLGNHEEWMLRTYRDHSAHSWIMGMDAFETITSYSASAADVLRQAINQKNVDLVFNPSKLPYAAFFDAMPMTHLHFFHSLKRCYRADGVFCSHGGVDTTIPDLDAQDPDTFMWGGDEFPDAYRGDEYIVYGHHNNAVLDAAGWPHPNLKANRTCGIDTCKYGVLTAIRFPGLDVFQSRRFTVGT